MSFTRAKPAGWSAGEQLTAAQMNALDIDHAAALDPIGGGTYTASTAITVNGAGWKFGGSNHQILGSAILTVLSGGFITVASGGELDIAGTQVVQSGGVITVASGGSISIASGGSIAWTSGSTESGTKTDSSTTTQTGTRIQSGSAGLTRRRKFQLTDVLINPGPLHVSSSDGDILYCTSLTGNGTIIIDNTGAATDHVMEITSRGMTGGHQIDVYADDEVTLLFSMTATTDSYARFWFNGTAWILLFKSS